MEKNIKVITPIQEIITKAEISKGEQGAKGGIGPAGADGQKGDTGPIGLTGPKGDTGDTGEKGPKGDTGEKGPKGDTGERSPKGDTGEKGLKGDNGDIGPKGDKGDIGPKGDKGDIGESPEHDWIGTSLRFKNPDGTWGKFQNLAPPTQQIPIENNRLPTTTQGKGTNPSFIFGRQGPRVTFVQATAPTPAQTGSERTYLWIQTQIGDNNDCTFWIEDGT